MEPQRLFNEHPFKFVTRVHPLNDILHVVNCCLDKGIPLRFLESLLRIGNRVHDLAGQDRTKQDTRRLDAVWIAVPVFLHPRALADRSAKNVEEAVGPLARRIIFIPTENVAQCLRIDFTREGCLRLRNFPRVIADLRHGYSRRPVDISIESGNFFARLRDLSPGIAHSSVGGPWTVSDRA
jgi:hypothetical protein